MRKPPRNAGHSRIAFLLLSAGLLLFFAGGIASAQVFWPVYASSWDNGSIVPAGTVSVPDGAGVAFSFIPAPGYMVYQVIADGVLVGANVPGYTFEGVRSQHTIQVTFAPIPGVEGYVPEVVVPGPGVYLFGGDFDRRRDAHDFSRRGVESRREAHPELRRPEQPRGGEPRGGQPGGGERGGERGGKR